VRPAENVRLVERWMLLTSELEVSYRTDVARFVGLKCIFDLPVSPRSSALSTKNGGKERESGGRGPGRL
jgi:hypothetical protein